MPDGRQQSRYVPNLSMVTQLMDARERFLRTLRFQQADRVPYFEQFIREDTVLRWQEEGMPKDVDVEQYFGLDHREEILVLLGKLQQVRGELRSREDFEGLKRYYNADSQQRYELIRKPEIERWSRRDYPLGLNAWQQGILQFMMVSDWKSLTSALFLFYDDPALVHEILEHMADFHVRGIEKVLRDMGMAVDFVFFSEPIAHNRGPVISPKMFLDFVIPRYKKVIEAVKRHGVDVIILRTSGNVMSLLPHCIEAGINVLWATETVRGNMDYLRVRERFGRSLALIGGIDAETLTRDKRAIEEEIMAKVPLLLSQGGYIPAIDNRPRSNIPLSNFEYYRELIRELSPG